MTSDPRKKEHTFASTSTWTGLNPVVEIGDLAVDTDASTIRIGDGTSRYNSLSDVGGSAGAANLSELNDALIFDPQDGDVLAIAAGAWINTGFQTVTLGPFFLNDVAADAVATPTSSFFNTSTALSQADIGIKMGAAGRVVGAILMSDTARTTGTATLSVLRNGVGASILSDSVVLNATNTTSVSKFGRWVDALAFTNTQVIKPSVTTVGWGPTTANMSVWLVVQIMMSP